MIPLSLVTGFLGSGKTSLLQHIVATNPHRRLVYVVNECGTVDIDGHLLQLHRDRLVRIPGGSIFCRCLAGEFVDWLTRIQGQCDASGGAVEGVVVEASGIADPKIVRQMLRETGLDRTYDLRMIVAVVDPGSFLKLIHTLPNIIAQIEAADLVLINKTDLYNDATLAETEREIRTINARVKILRTRHGRVDIDVFAESSPQPLEGRYAGCLDPNYSVTTIVVDAPVDFTRLATDLGGLGDAVYRVKGFVSSPTGCVYIDLAAGRLSVQPVESPLPGSLVFIAGPAGQPAIDRIAADIRNGVYSPQSV